jgi:hypothetical protein
VWFFSLSVAISLAFHTVLFDFKKYEQLFLSFAKDADLCERQDSKMFLLRGGCTSS